MNNYIKQLEDENEELRNALAKSQNKEVEYLNTISGFKKYMPLWYKDIIRGRIKGPRCKSVQVVTYGTLCTGYRVGWVEETENGWVAFKDMLNDRINPFIPPVRYHHRKIDGAKKELEDWFKKQIDSLNHD